MTPRRLPDLKSHRGIKLVMALALSRPSLCVFTLRVLPRPPKWEEKGRFGVAVPIFPSEPCNVFLTATGSIGLASTNAYLGLKRSRAPATHRHSILRAQGHGL